MDTEQVPVLLKIPRFRLFELAKHEHPTVVSLDASLVKAHQQAATGKKGAPKTRRWGVPEED